MKTITRTITLFIIVALASTSSVQAEEIPAEIAEPFTDSVGHWAEPYIEDIRLRGIIDGKDIGIFGPNDFISRAEITKIAMETFVGTFDRRSSGENVFPDVEYYDWYGVYIDQAKERGIIKGYSDGTFKPNGYVTRVEALKILLEASDLDFTDPDSQVNENDPNAWYKPYLTYAEENDLIYTSVLNRATSDATISLYQPHNNATRAEVAKFTSLIVKAEEESHFKSYASVSMLDEEESLPINLYYGFDTDNYWKTYTNNDYGFSFNFPAIAARAGDNDYFKTTISEQDGIITMNIADGAEVDDNGVKVYFGKAKNEDELAELVRERFGEGCELHNLGDQTESYPVENYGFGVSEEATDPSECSMGKPRLTYNHDTETAVFYSISNGLFFNILGQGGSYADLYPYDLNLELD